MKITMMLLMFCVLAFAPSAFAQTNTINLFESRAVRQGDSRFPANGPFVFANAISFDEATVFCPAGGTGTLSGPLTGGGFIADNFLTVNGTNVCPNGTAPDGQGNCFSSFDGDAANGEPIEQSFGAVGPIALNLSAGGLFTFRLMDYGGQFGNTTINLTNTNCTLVQQNEEGQFAVCHRNNRNKNGKKTKDGEYKTIYVDTLEDFESHVQHGDAPRPCTATEEPPRMR